jgi:hypothetical protein
MSLVSHAVHKGFWAVHVSFVVGKVTLGQVIHQVSQLSPLTFHFTVASGSISYDSLTALYPQVKTTGTH